VNKPDIRRASLEEIERMDERGELYHDPDAAEGPPPGEELPDDFWETATVTGPPRPRSVHLKLDADVFDFFYSESNGKGHITRMQDVLRAYADARRKRRAG
jgi:uncharacterized protein (DUF4415 family)